MISSCARLTRFLVRWFEQNLHIFAGSEYKHFKFRWSKPSQQHMSRSAVSPRVFQPYSPRRPSPLGLPPFTPQGSQDIPCSAYPKTPERYYLQHYSEPTTSHGMRFPPDVHRRTASSTQRTRALPPAPLSLDAQYHPAAVIVHLPSIEETLQPHSTSTQEEMHAPPSPTPSSTSSLSLYSNDSAKKSLEIGEEGKGKEGNKGGGGGGFCICFSASFRSYLFNLFYSFIDIFYYSRLLSALR